MPGSHVKDGPPGSVSRQTLAWTLLAVGGGLLAGAVTANVAREMSIAHYNDDHSCFYGNLSRTQRCGTSLGEADVEGIVAITAYAGAAVALGGSAFFFATAAPVTGSGAGRWQTTADAVWRF
jgi:hypothetical protein